MPPSLFEARLKNCESATCTRRFNPDGTSRCVGMHCPYCGEPCGSHGHDCDGWDPDKTAKEVPYA